MTLSFFLQTFVIRTQIYVALMGTLLATFFMLAQNAYQATMLPIVFSTYLCGYLYTRYQKTLFKKKIFIPVVLSAIISIFFIIIFFSLNLLFRWTCIILLGILYNSCFLKFSARKIPLVKIFFVGLCWALINSWLISPSWNSTIFFICFFWVSALVLPFDIRDKEKDDVLTFPILFGIKNTKFLSCILMFFANIMNCIYLKSCYSISFISAVGLSCLFVLYSSVYRKELFYSLGVETCVALPFFCLLIFL